ncbi:MAG TPA: hypothetical protein ENK16_04500, partial [Chromatiales bacterium]|nr:hypothetical protein [Chromatiales bacterium]
MVSISNYQARAGRVRVDPRIRSGSNRPGMNGPSSVSSDDLQQVLSAYRLTGARCEPLGHGLINLTMSVTTSDGRRFVLQRINPVFPAEVNRDIDVVTRRLARAGLITPCIVPAADGQLWVALDDGIWRLQTFIDGKVHESVQDCAQAVEAGALL